MLRRKTLLAISVTLVCLVVLLYLVFRVLLLGSYAEFERASVERNISRVLNALEDDRQELLAITYDWAHWDDTYEYIVDRNPEYEAANLLDETFAVLRLDVVMFVDLNGDIVFARGFDAEEGVAGQVILSAFEDRLARNDSLFRNILDQPDAVDRTGHSGLVLTPSGVFMVSAAPILNSEANAPARGVLMWGRMLSNAEAERISELTQLDVTFYGFHERELPRELYTIQEQAGDGEGVIVTPLSDREVAAYTVVSDLDGFPVLGVRIATDRQVFQQGVSTLNYLVGAFIVAGIVFGGVMLGILDRLILKRVANLSHDLRTISLSGQHGGRVRVEGNDEFTHLQQTMNNTLEALALSRRALEQLNADLEQRVAERTSALENRQAFLQTLLDAMNEAVVYGTDEEIYYLNNVVHKMTGYTAEELIGQPRGVLFVGSSPGRRRLLLDRETDTGPIYQGERKLRCKDGSQLDVLVTMTPIIALDGKSGNILIIRDLTEDKALQSRRDRFLANASHELRTPLTNLMTRLYLLRKQPENLDTHLDILDGIVAHMKSLVDDLLDLSRFRKGTIPLKRENTVLQELIEEVVALQQHEARHKNIALSSYLPEAEIIAFVDRKRILQVLTNLVTNAINYTPTDGEVRVELDTSLVGSYEYAVIRVVDTGIGMSEESMAQVFQPFFRASQEIAGTGLGLSIVKEIVDRHGGEITVESELGKGSCFSVKLMTSRPSAANGPA